MQLVISEGQKVGELQEGFNGKFPYLKLELYRVFDTALGIRKVLGPESILKYAEGVNSESFEIKDIMTVNELEKLLIRHFSLKAIIYRKAGVFWLETTLTSGWTLRKQNDHGRELTSPVKRKAGEI